MTRALLMAGLLLPTAALAQHAGGKVSVGKPAPDFTVTGIDGKSFKLSDITATGKNVVLIFSRAHW